MTAGCAWRLERGCRVDLPRWRVIASLPSDHTRAIELLHGEPPFLLDPLYAQQQRPDRYCAARNAVVTIACDAGAGVVVRFGPRSGSGRNDERDRDPTRYVWPVTIPSAATDGLPPTMASPMVTR